MLALFAWARWGPMDPLFRSPSSSILLDTQGRLMNAAVAADGQWRFPAGPSVPDRYARCLIEFEDRRFRYHPGIDPTALFRAWRQNRKAGRTVSGGSTLTMQVARLAGGNGPRTYGTKVLEMLIALRLEVRYSKDAILALHAAHAPFGGNVVGLEAAAWRWFAAPPDRLSWAQCATLAVLPNAPATIHPGKGRAALRAKRDRLLDRLLAVGTIDSTEWSLAREEDLPEAPLPLPHAAPHLFTTLTKQQGAGHRMITTVDRDLQQRATAAMERYAPRLRANEVHNAAALLMEVRSGRVLAYVGNLPGAGRTEAGDVDIIRARRSTGSTLKPFLYADMLQSGELLPDMLVADVPTRFDGFAPRNYDEQYQGAVPAGEALSRSLNVPAVRMLRTHGIERTLMLLRRMGLNSIDRSAENYGLSLIVGGAESTLWELAGAYASMGRTLDDFGRGGQAYHPGDIHPPVVLAGDTLRPVPTGPPAPPPLTAAAIHFTLRALGGTARPAEDAGWEHFTGNQRIAWKTGTSYGHRDAWAIGLSDRYCIAVWTGNASGEGRPGLTGSLASAPLLFDLFALLPRGGSLPAPHDELVPLPICRMSGHRAGIDCAPVDTLPMPPEGVRTATCPYHRTIVVDAEQRYRVSPDEGRTVRWFALPPAMERYYKVRVPGYRPLPRLRVGAEDGEVMELLYPVGGSRVLIPRGLSGALGRVVAEAAHRDDGTTLHWDLDGVYLGSTRGDHRMAFNAPAGDHVLTLTDAAGRSLRRTFMVIAANAPHP